MIYELNGRTQIEHLAEQILQVMPIIAKVSPQFRAVV